VHVWLPTKKKRNMQTQSPEKFPIPPIKSEYFSSSTQLVFSLYLFGLLIVVRNEFFLKQKNSVFPFALQIAKL
jgi:hypothetical protein